MIGGRERKKEKERKRERVYTVYQEAKPSDL